MRLSTRHVAGLRADFLQTLQVLVVGSDRARCIEPVLAEGTDFYLNIRVFHSSSSLTAAAQLVSIQFLNWFPILHFNSDNLGHIERLKRLNYRKRIEFVYLKLCIDLITYLLCNLLWINHPHYANDIPFLVQLSLIQSSECTKLLGDKFLESG